MRIASYLRVSGRSQVDRDGLVRQRDAAHRYSAAHQLTSVVEFTDPGVSGTKGLEKRKGLSDALAWLCEGEGDRWLLVESADRLARSLLVSEMILMECRERGVKVIATVSGMDLTAGDDDPVSVMLRQILGAVAEFDKTTFVLRTRAARERIRKQKGKCEGPKPYGTLPGEEKHLWVMRGLRKRGHSYAAIAASFNNRSIPTRHGGPWHRSTIHSILKRTKGRS